MLFILSLFISKNKIAHSSSRISLDTIKVQRRRTYAKAKYYLAIDNYEYSVIIDSLNNLRNKLIADGRYTDAVDELIIKFAHAPIKKFKIKMTEL